MLPRLTLRMFLGVALKTSATDFGKVTGRRVEEFRDRL